MEVRPGALLHGDRHGILNVPFEIAPAIPEVAATLEESEQKLIAFCRSNSFSIEKLSELLKTLK